MMHSEIIGGVPLQNLHREVLATRATRIPLHLSRREHHYPMEMLDRWCDATAKSTLRAKPMLSTRYWHASLTAC